MAWRVSNEGWYFIALEEVVKNEKSYSITLKKAKSIDRWLERVIAEMSKIPIKEVVTT